MDGFDPFGFLSHELPEVLREHLPHPWGSSATPHDPHSQPPQPGKGTPHGSGHPPTPDHHTEPVAPHDHTHQHAPEHPGPLHPGHVTIHADGGDAGALIRHDPRLDHDGSLSVIGVKHQLGHAGVGSYVTVTLPNGDHLPAKVTHINAKDDSYRAEIEPEEAKACLKHLPVALTAAATELGEAIEFDHTAGTDGCDILRRGYVAGYDHGLVALGGTDAGPGASGSPVFDGNGHFVGQVVAYDYALKVNLMVPADRILADMDDFAAGRNLESKASPVNYSH